MRFSTGLISTSNGLDWDAYRFISAATITNSTEISAINTLVKSAKTNGWWNRCIAIYPMVGGTSSTCKWNLKDPRDLDAAYRLTFYGAPVFSSTGVDWDGVSDYALTHIVPQNVLPFSDAHMSYYSREDIDTLTNVMGNYPSSFLHPGIGPFNGGRYAVNSGDASPFIDDGITSGHFIVDRISSTQTKGYRNGINTITNDAYLLDTGRSYEIALATAGFYGSYSGQTEKECAFATIGYGLGSSIITNMYADIQTFQTTLGRNV